MELDKQQIERLRERHHRRHGIRPAHSEAMENVTRFSYVPGIPVECKQL